MIHIGVLQNRRYLLLMKQFINKCVAKRMGEHMKRRIVILCIAIVMILAKVPYTYAYASEDYFLKQDFYIETTISESNYMPKDSGAIMRSAKKKVTKTKMVTGREKDGKAAWSVSITATFTYDGNTSQCVSCSHEAESFKKEWKIKSVSSKKSGNAATATAVVTHTSGSISKDFKQAVTISCSASGIVS